MASGGEGRATANRGTPSRSWAAEEKKRAGTTSETSLSRGRERRSGNADGVEGVGGGRAGREALGAVPECSNYTVHLRWPPAPPGLRKKDPPPTGARRKEDRCGHRRVSLEVGGRLGGRGVTVENKEEGGGLEEGDLFCLGEPSRAQGPGKPDTLRVQLLSL